MILKLADHKDRIELIEVSRIKTETLISNEVSLIAYDERQNLVGRFVITESPEGDDDYRRAFLMDHGKTVEVVRQVDPAAA